MRSINKVQLVGTVASNPEINQEVSKRVVFPLAISRDWNCEDNTKKESVDYYSVVAFGRLADAVMQHLVKGSPVLIEGRLQNRCFDGSDGKRHFITEVVLESLSIMVYKKSKYGLQVNTVCVSDQGNDNDKKLAEIKAILA